MAAGLERRDRSRKREDRPVLIAGQNHAEAGAGTRVDDESRGLDASLAQRLDHEAPELIIPEHPDNRGPQPEAGRSAGHDRAGPADREIGRIDQSLGLPEDRLHRATAEDQVGVAVPEDEQVEVSVRHDPRGRTAGRCCGRGRHRTARR